MQLFSWNIENREFEEDLTSEENYLIDHITHNARKQIPDQRKMNEKMLMEATRSKNISHYIRILDEHGKLFLERLGQTQDRTNFESACRGHYFYGMQRRFITAAGHMAGWQNLGDKAWNALPAKQRTVFEDDHLKTLVNLQTNGRERIRNWERGIISQLSIPACASPCRNFETQTPGVNQIQKYALEVIGDDETSTAYCIQALSNHGKRRLSLIGKLISLKSEAENMPWIWAGIEGEPVSSPFTEAEETNVRFTRQQAGLILLKGVAQRAFLRQTIRQESYALQTPLIVNLLQQAEEQALIYSPGEEPETRLAFASQVAWDLICRLDSRGILKGDRYTRS